MQYRHLPSTGLKVSEICLGTMTFGGQTSAEDSKNIIACALDNGVNFIDTANIYTQGQSESIIGEALGSRRDQVILATKTGGPTARIPNASGLSRRQIITSVEDSLKRMKTDYIDVFYLHFPDKLTPPEEYIETVTTLIRSGKIRYWGVSNFSAWQCCELVHKAKEMGAIAPVVTENVYSAINRGIEGEMTTFLQKYQLGLTVFNPLAGGLLTGKHDRNHYTEGTRFALEKGYAMRYWNDRNFDAIDILKDVAAENGMTMVELSYKWLLSKPWVTSIICGVSKFSQIEENVTYSTEAALSPEIIAKCDSVWSMIHGSYFNYHR